MPVVQFVPLNDAVVDAIARERFCRRTVGQTVEQRREAWGNVAPAVKRQYVQEVWDELLPHAVDGFTGRVEGV